MAKLSFDYPRGQISQLDRLMSEDLACKMVNAATPVIKKHLVRRLAGHVQSGDLRKSIQTKKAKRFDHSDGVYGVVWAYGKDHKGVKNGSKLAMMEYGTSKYPPTPVVAPAMASAEAEAVAAAQAVYNQEINKK